MHPRKHEKPVWALNSWRATRLGFHRLGQSSTNWLTIAGQSSTIAVSCTGWMGSSVNLSFSCQQDLPNISLRHRVSLIPPAPWHWQKRWIGSMFSPRSLHQVVSENAHVCRHMFVYVCVLISNSLQIHIGIETRIFLTLWKLIYIPPALPGRCVFLCDMPCCPHQRIHTVQRNQTESWSRKHHFKLSLSSQSTKLMLAGLEDALLSPFPISLHNLLPCNSPPSVPHMQFCISHCLLLTQSRTGISIQVKNVIELTSKCPRNLPDLASLFYGPHLPLHVSTAKVQLYPAAASFWLWKILRKPG